VSFMGHKEGSENSALKRASVQESRIKRESLVLRQPYFILSVFE